MVGFFSTTLRQALGHGTLGWSCNVILRLVDKNPVNQLEWLKQFKTLLLHIILYVTGYLPQQLVHAGFCPSMVP